MPKFRKKPVVIEAVQFTGENFREVVAFCRTAFASLAPNELVIPTLEGNHIASTGDWIIKGVGRADGTPDFYPCKPDIFAATYEEEVHEETPLERGVHGF